MRRTVSVQQGMPLLLLRLSATLLISVLSFVLIGITAGPSLAHQARMQTVSLASIDLPNMDPGALTPPWGGSGWMVPEPLRARWTLELGDSRALLPTVLSILGSVGLFFHDSLHTYDHMLWEYETAWPYLKPAGLLVSDDISRNDAFSEFCRSRRMTYRVVGGFGIARRS